MDADRRSGPPTPRAFQALHDELVAGAGRRRPRHRAAWPTVLVAAAAAIVALVVVSGVLATGDDPVAADVKVERAGDHVTVSIEAEVDVREVEAALRRAGVVVTVTAQTTGPSRVGQFVGIVGPPDAVLEGGDGTSSHRATFTAGSPVRILLGVAARRGQAYDVATEPTAVGEPFAGQVIEGRTLSEVRDVAAAHPEVRIDLRGATGQPTSSASPGAVVLRAQMLAADRLVLFVR